MTGSPDNANTLVVRGLTKHFGGLTAVDQLDFELKTGEILGLIGPNGAGKTTTFNLVAGALKASEGSVVLGGDELLGTAPHDIAQHGIIRTFQHNMPFTGMSVIDNILVGAHTRLGRNFWRILGAPGATRQAETEARGKAEELVRFVGLEEARDTDVVNLSFGQGRLLELARALAAEPRFIMLDEPAAGLTHAECDRLSEIIAAIAERGIGVLLIEHDMRFLLPLAHRVVVLNFGRKIAEGDPKTIREDPAVIDAYLGEVGDPAHAATAEGG
jgi:ABC-type branched-subunit amino acid transport system ATPase component